jgi:hypothetical protein
MNGGRQIFFPFAQSYDTLRKRSFGRSLETVPQPGSCFRKNFPEFFLGSVSHLYIDFNKKIVLSAEMKFWHRLPKNVLKFHFSTQERMTNFMLKAL